MITKSNFSKLLQKLGFNKKGDVYIKNFGEFELKVDFKEEKLIYPESLKVNDLTTSNFSKPENFVVFECVHRLLEKGYNPKHLEIEPKWSLGHLKKSGKADIGIKDNNGKNLVIIECKTYGDEYEKALKLTKVDGGQLFSYAANSGSEYIALYASDENANFEYFLISLKDNRSYLENNPHLKSYEEAKKGKYGDIAKALFEVWSTTYKQQNIKGLFEKDVRAYELEKKKFSVNDLKVVSENDIQKIYHKFATILRAHNVSSRENAFDKLVNLFLCKIVDERKNPNDLQFIYKGAMQDDEFSFVDRLQKLYKEGMKEFLKEDITYIENSEIDEYFKVFDAKTVKLKVKEAIKKIKFFTSNDFAFIDVHNERLFYQNFEVLLKIVKLFENYYLTKSDENQFLGDLFEGFLDQGIKQNEGQYFTPMPIVKFIISSLPNKQYKNVIDYACGAGHFLNEFAKVYKPKHIVGIEKEYRLSKVAKVSTLMYGYEAEIIYDDTLKKETIKEKFDVLVSNPPYSVKGFLETLDEKDIKSFEISSVIDTKSYATNNAIECFFIEKAKQILNDEAIAAIIVPISILDKSNSKLFIKTREIILKYFNLKAIVKLPTKTFGKTGTTTIILYMQKRNEKEDIANNFLDIANSIFENKFNILDEFKYKSYFEEFIDYMGYNKKAYFDFLKGKYNKSLFLHEIFKTYKEEFIKSLKEKEKTLKNYKKLKQKFIKEVKQKEKERLFYFMLAKFNGNVTVILPPNKNDEIKKFLGYEWSEAKGNEGIKYISSKKIDDEILDKEDLRTLSNITTINNIKTPLYNPKNLDDETKLNKIIKNTLENKELKINKELEKYVKVYSLTSMLDLKEAEFNKVISLNGNKEIEIKSKYPLVKLGEVVDNITGKRPKGGAIDSGVISLGGEHIQNGRIDLTNPKYIPIEFAKKIPKAKVKKYDVLMCKDGAKSGKVAFVDKEIEAYVNEHIFILRAQNPITNKYVFEFLFSNKGEELLKSIITGSAQGGINSTNLKNLKIPLPPLDIQEKIVKECEEIDKETKKAKEENEKLKKEIEEIIENINFNKKSLKELVVFNPSKKEIAHLDEHLEVSFIPMEYVSNNGYIEKMDIKKLKELKNGSYTYFKEKDIIIAKITPSMENGKCAIAINLKNNIALGSSEFHVFRVKNPNILDFRYLFYFLNRKIIRNEAQKVMTGSSGHKRVPIKFYQHLQIPLPPLEIQKQIVSQIEKLEEKIRKNQEIINTAKEKKEKILKKYLEG